MSWPGKFSGPSHNRNVAVSSASPTHLWTYINSDGDDPTGGVAVGPSGVSYHLGSRYSLVAVNPDGTEKWIAFPSSFFPGTTRQVPLLDSSENIYLINGDASLQKFSTVDGSLLWTYTFTDEVAFSIVQCGLTMDADGNLHAFSYDHFGNGTARAYCINQSGALVWSQDVDLNDSVTGTTSSGMEMGYGAADADSIYYIAAGSICLLVKLNRATGAVVWRKFFENVTFGAIWGSNSCVISPDGTRIVARKGHSVATSDYVWEFWCFNTSDGSEVWHTAAMGSGYPVSEGALPCIDSGNNVYVGTSQNLGNAKARKLNAADGSIAWTFDSGINADMLGGVITSDALVIMTRNGHVYRLSTTDGSQLDTFSLPDTSYSNQYSHQLAVISGRIYITGPDNANALYAYSVTEAPVCDIAVSPSSVNAEVGSAVQFTASGASALGGVTWSVQSGGGSIDSTGLYTAPSANGSATIRATSVSDPTCHADATITVLHACENFPPQMWLFTANREISRWQPECRRDLQLGTNEETGTPIPNWLYSTGWQELDKPGRIAGIGTDPSDSITVTVAKTVNGTSPNQGRSFVAEPALGQDDVWNETPAADMKAYKWRLQFEGANTATLRAAGYALEGVSGVGG